jgi:hypothetical protein
VPQRFDECTFSALVLECCNLLWRQSLLPPQRHTPLSGLPNPIHLPLGPEFGFELRNGAQHMEQQASRGIAGVDMLIEDLEMDLLAVECRSDLAQMQGGAGEPIEARHHERVPFPHIFQTRG